MPRESDKLHIPIKTMCYMFVSTEQLPTGPQQINCLKIEEMHDTYVQDINKNQF